MVTSIPTIPATPNEIQPPSVLLQDISWETYRALVKDLESQPGKRLTYDRGMLEILMPLPPMKSIKSTWPASWKL